MWPFLCTLLFFLSGSLTKSVYKDPHCTTFTVLLFKVSTFLVLMLTNAWFSESGCPWPMSWPFLSPTSLGSILHDLCTELRMWKLCQSCGAGPHHSRPLQQDILLDRHGSSSSSSSSIWWECEHFYFLTLMQPRTIKNTTVPESGFSCL